MSIYGSGIGDKQALAQAVIEGDKFDKINAQPAQTHGAFGDFLFNLVSDTRKIFNQGTSIIADTGDNIGHAAKAVNEGIFSQTSAILKPFENPLIIAGVAITGTVIIGIIIVVLVKV